MKESKYGVGALLAMVLVLICVGCTEEERGKDGANGARQPADDAGEGATTAAGEPDASHDDRFYVANTDGASVSVIDHASRAVIATVDLDNQPHGNAPAPEGDFVYVTTDGGDGEVIAIKTVDHTVAWRIDAGAELNEPHLTRDGRLLFAPDLLAARVAVVDVTQQQVVDEIAMVDDAGNNLLALHNTYASHDGRHMYVTAIFSDKIAQIDVESRQITRLYELSGQPRPAALTEDDRTMYIQLSELHGFIELDLESGEETARIEWPEPTVPDETRSQAETIPTKCHGIGIRPDGGELWAATNLEGAVYVYSLPGLEKKARFEVGNYPNWIAFSSDGTTGYVTNTDPLADHGTVSVIDAERHEVIDTLDVGPAPKRIHRVRVPTPQ